MVAKLDDGHIACPPHGSLERAYSWSSPETRRLAGRRSAVEPDVREKMFGPAARASSDRNAKVRIMHWARCLSRGTEKDRAYGPQMSFGVQSGPRCHMQVFE